MSTESGFADGGCTCRFVRYRMTTKPLFVHCCHCRWCQRETGASFALNALIEVDHVQLLQGEVAVINTPSNSGKGQRISRCPRCHIALWSNYAGAGDALRFIRVGTLDLPAITLPPTSIFTPLQSNRGCSCRPMCPLWPSTTKRPRDGQRKVSKGERQCKHGWSNAS